MACRRAMLQAMRASMVTAVTFTLFCRPTHQWCIVHVEAQVLD